MEKQFKSVTKYDYKTFKYFNMYNLFARKAIILYIVICILSLGGIALSVFGKNKNYLLAAIFALAFVWFIYQYFNLENTIDKNLVNHFANRKVMEQYFTVNSDKIIVESVSDPSKVAEYDWAYVNQIVEIPQYYYLMMGKQPLIIDKNPDYIIEGDLEILAEIIKEKAELKPYKKLDREFVKKPITYVHKVILDDIAEADVSEVNTAADEEVKEVPVETEEVVEEVKKTEENSDKE